MLELTQNCRVSFTRLKPGLGSLNLSVRGYRQSGTYQGVRVVAAPGFPWSGSATTHASVSDCGGPGLHVLFAVGPVSTSFRHPSLGGLHPVSGAALVRWRSLSTPSPGPLCADCGVVRCRCRWLTELEVGGDPVGGARPPELAERGWEGLPEGQDPQPCLIAVGGLHPVSELRSLFRCAPSLSPPSPGPLSVSDCGAPCHTRALLVSLVDGVGGWG